MKVSSRNGKYPSDVYLNNNHEKLCIMCDRVILEFKQVVVYMCNYDTKAVERFQLFFLPFQYHPTAILEMYAW